MISPRLVSARDTGDRALRERHPSPGSPWDCGGILAGRTLAFARLYSKRVLPQIQRPSEKLLCFFPRVARQLGVRSVVRYRIGV